MTAKAYFDGRASRMNPARASVGFALSCASQEVSKGRRLSIPCGDINQAEYAALLLLMKDALLLGCKKLTVRSDSEVVVRQIKGIYRPPTAKHLFTIHQACLFLIEWFESFEIIHVPRTENRKADSLACEALAETYA